MKKKNWILTILLAVNIALGAALVLRGTHGSSAYAQARGGRPAFMTISGHPAGRLVYYVLDTNTGRLAVLSSIDGTKPIPIASTIVSDDLDRIFGRH